MSQPLMPKATAVWLIENTSLTFDQIAQFCGLHPLEVKGIADGDVAAGVRGLDPVANGQLAREELDKAQADESYMMKVLEAKIVLPKSKSKKGPRYTPLSRRQDRPDAIAWVVRNHPEISDAQISKLLGTTKTTIVAVRDRTHWNSQNIKPIDPVTLGLCSQIELDEIVAKAATKRAKMMADKGEIEGPTLAPAQEVEAEPDSSALESEASSFTPKSDEDDEFSAESVFGSKAD